MAYSNVDDPCVVDDVIQKPSYVANVIKGQKVTNLKKKINH